METPIGTSTTPPLDLAGHGEDLAALALVGAHRREGRRAVEHDPRDVGEGLDVVDVGGLPHSPLAAGTRAQPGMPRLPSMEAMSAVSSPQRRRRRPP
jgi:hypothetical protein